MFLDAACSSSGYAINTAYSAIRGGECDAALICGSQLLLSPMSSMVLQRGGILNKDGHCRPFDQEAGGFVRGEAVVAVFLQKAEDARRVYATLVHCRTNCDGFKEEGIYFPSSKSQTELMTKFYQEIDMNPNVVNYVEAHCTGIVRHYLTLYQTALSDYKSELDLARMFFSIYFRGINRQVQFRFAVITSTVIIQNFLFSNRCWRCNRMQNNCWYFLRRPNETIIGGLCKIKYRTY
jgi:hypothetical protein